MGLTNAHSSETTKLIQGWFKKCFSGKALHYSMHIGLRFNHNHFQFHTAVIRFKWVWDGWLIIYRIRVSFFWGGVCACSDRYSFHSVMGIFPYLCHRFFSWHRFLEVRSICRGFVDNTSCSWVFWLSLLEHPSGRMCCGYFAHCGKLRSVIQWRWRTPGVFQVSLLSALMKYHLKWLAHACIGFYSESVSA